MLDILKMLWKVIRIYGSKLLWLLWQFVRARVIGLVWKYATLLFLVLVTVGLAWFVLH